MRSIHKTIDGVGAESVTKLEKKLSLLSSSLHISLWCCVLCATYSTR